MEEFDSYKSIAAPVEGLYKESGSRFLAFAYPVESAEEAKELVSALKKEYHDARHHCCAFRIGYKGDILRASDDGEPSGTGGKPILSQIESAGLSDVLIVVVRYFGGVKLGIPGLARAYKTAAADALAKAEIVAKTAAKLFRVEFDYLRMNDIMKALKALGLTPGAPEYAGNCSIIVRVRLSQENIFKEKLQNIANLKEI